MAEGTNLGVDVLGVQKSENGPNWFENNAIVDPTGLRRHRAAHVIGFIHKTTFRFK